MSHLKLVDTHIPFPKPDPDFESPVRLVDPNRKKAESVVPDIKELMEEINMEIQLKSSELLNTFASSMGIKIEDVANKIGIISDKEEDMKEDELPEQHVIVHWQGSNYVLMSFRVELKDGKPILNITQTALDK